MLNERKNFLLFSFLFSRHVHHGSELIRNALRQLGFCLHLFPYHFFPLRFSLSLSCNHLIFMFLCLLLTQFASTSARRCVSKRLSISFSVQRRNVIFCKKKKNVNYFSNNWYHFLVRPNLILFRFLLWECIETCVCFTCFCAIVVASYMPSSTFLSCSLSLLFFVLRFSCSPSTGLSISIVHIPRTKANETSTIKIVRKNEYANSLSFFSFVISLVCYTQNLSQKLWCMHCVRLSSSSSLDIILL